MQLGVVYAREGYLETLSLLISRGDRVGAVDPAVRVQYVLGQVFAVYTVDGVAHVLSGRDDQRERDQQDHREAVVQPEDGCVDVYVRNLDQAFQAPEYVQHLGSSGDEYRREGYHWITTAARSPVDPLDLRLSHLSPAFDLCL